MLIKKMKRSLVVLAGISLLAFVSFKSAEEPQVELVLDAQAMLGEGALWHPKEKKLYWVDIEGKALHVYDPATKKDKQFPVGERIGTVVPVEGGGALVALQNGIHKLDTK